jgi:hypothetical protein
MPITLPEIRSLPLLMAFCLCTGSLCAQMGQQFPIEASQREAAEQADLPTTTDHLTGVVVSTVDGSAVARAQVTSTDRRFASFTDSQGRFSFDLRRTVPVGSTQALSSYPPDPAAAPSSLSVSFAIFKPGYVRDVLSFQLPALQPDSPEPPLILKIVPTGVITGHLYTESGDFPKTLNVQLLRKLVNNGTSAWLPANGTNVNSRGEFRFANLDPGDYKLFVPAHLKDGDPTAKNSASVSGFLPTYYPNGAREDSAAILPVGAGASVVADLNLHKAPFYDVTIPLASPPGKGFTRAILINGAPGLILQQGSQSFDGHLPDGTYDLLLSSSEPRTPNDQNPLLSSAFIKIDVDGKAVRTPPVALQPTTEVPIVVRREFTSGQPQPPTPQNQPSVYLYLQNVRQDLSVPAPSMRPNTNDEGLSLVGVNPGVYNVTVAARAGPSAYVASATSGSTDLLREPLQVLPDSIPRPIEITLRDDFASIDATITVDPATPPATAASPILLICLPLDRLQTNPAFSQAQQNHSVVANLAPGRYLLLAMHDLRHILTVEYSNPEVLRSLMQKGTVVTLAPNEKATAQVPLMPDGDN